METSKPSAGARPAPIPRRSDLAIDAAADAEMNRLKRQKGLQSTMVTQGFLSMPVIEKKQLKEKTGV